MAFHGTPPQSKRREIRLHPGVMLIIDESDARNEVEPQQPVQLPVAFGDPLPTFGGDKPEAWLRPKPSAELKTIMKPRREAAVFGHVDAESHGCCNLENRPVCLGIGPELIPRAAPILGVKPFRSHRPSIREEILDLVRFENVYNDNPYLSRPRSYRFQGRWKQWIPISKFQRVFPLIPPYQAERFTIKEELQVISRLESPFLANSVSVVEFDSLEEDSGEESTPDFLQPPPATVPRPKSRRNPASYGFTPDPHLAGLRGRASEAWLEKPPYFYPSTIDVEEDSADDELSSEATPEETQDLVPQSDSSVQFEKNWKHWTTYGFPPEVLCRSSLSSSSLDDDTVYTAENEPGGPLFKYRPRTPATVTPPSAVLDDDDDDGIVGQMSWSCLPPPKPTRIPRYMKPCLSKIVKNVSELKCAKVVKPVSRRDLPPHLRYGTFKRSDIPKPRAVFETVVEPRSWYTKSGKLRTKPSERDLETDGSLP